MIKLIKAGVILIILVIGLFIMLSFMPGGERKVIKRLNDKDIYPSSRLLNYKDNQRINVTMVGDPSKTTLVLIHGSPGDWSAWENIIANDSIRTSYYILAIDRAGYGKTTVPALARLGSQANVVWQALVQLQRTNNIVMVGHSYGGAVIEQLLLDHPEASKRAILVAPTLSPELMKPRWYNKVAKWKAVNYIISKDLKSSNIEMLGLPNSLQLNEEHLNSIHTPIIYIQGKKDILVPHETVDYFKSRKPQGVNYIVVDDMNHFTPWSHPYLITNAILEK